MRPRSVFPQKVADAICERIAEGEPLRAICREDGMPAWRTIYAWLDEHPEFAARFARAREVGFDAIAAEALQIADTPVAGVRTETTDDGKTKEVREDMLGHRKLQIETRLKLLAKWSPKRYGDKIEQTLQGPDGQGLRIELVNYAAKPQEKS
jgi:hypothetical protein